MSRILFVKSANVTARICTKSHARNYYYYLFSSCQYRIYSSKNQTNASQISEQKHDKQDNDELVSNNKGTCTSIAKRSIQIEKSKNDNGHASYFIVSDETKNQINAMIAQAQSIPNIITIARILSTPLLCNLIITEKYQLAVVGCFIAGFSDWLDGYIAKNYDQQTVFGTYLDPLADKILINSIAISLSYADILPIWSSALWLGRDVILVGMTYRVAAAAAKGMGYAIADPAKTPLKISPTMISKANTMFQFGTIGVALSLGAICEVGYSLNFGYSSFGLVESLSYVTATTTILSGLSYMDGKSMIKSGNSPKKKM